MNDPFTGPKFPKSPGHRSLERQVMEDEHDLYSPALFVNAFSRVPYRVQVWLIRIKLFVQRTLS